jgi:hypothetical protein
MAAKAPERGTRLKRAARTLRLEGRLKVLRMVFMGMRLVDYGMDRG